MLAEASEEARRELVEAVLEDLNAALEAIARYVGGEVRPDTVLVRTAAEVVLAAAAYVAAEGGRLRVVAPKDPLPGWNPLNALLEALAEAGIAEIYRVEVRPTARRPASELARRAAKLLKGLSPKVVDVTDAAPFHVLAAYASGVRALSILVDLDYAAVFQRLPLVPRP
ncbi:MAG: hypothetical protein ABWW70_07565 [Thermoproteota archaeon]